MRPASRNRGSGKPRTHCIIERDAACLATSVYRTRGEGCEAGAQASRPPEHTDGPASPAADCRPLPFGHVQNPPSGSANRAAAKLLQSLSRRYTLCATARSRTAPPRHPDLTHAKADAVTRSPPRRIVRHRQPDSRRARDYAGPQLHAAPGVPQFHQCVPGGTHRVGVRAAPPAMVARRALHAPSARGARQVLHPLTSNPHELRTTLACTAAREVVRPSPPVRARDKHKAAAGRSPAAALMLVQPSTRDRPRRYPPSYPHVRRTVREPALPRGSHT
jgi:hypothetical protein